MGTVYLSQHVALPRKAAIKSLHKNLLTNASIRTRFRNEAAMLSSIDHPNIVKLYDYVEAPEGYFLIMEFIEGNTLDEIIQERKGGVPVHEIIGIMRGLLSAFSFAHARGIIHRDVKPSNIIIIQGTLEAKILDFGIAKIMTESGKGLTKAGAQMGTIYVMSPEQVRSGHIDNRSDIYSLGVTLYQMATGINPYKGLTSEFEIYNQIVNHALPDPKNYNPQLPKHIIQVIDKATRKDPAERFQTCDEFLNALLLETRPIVNKKFNTSSEREIQTPGSRIKWETIAGIVGVLFIMAVLSFFIYSYFSNSLESSEERLWSSAQKQNSLELYTQYINKFPGGVYIEEAKRERDAIREAHLTASFIDVKAKVEEAKALYFSGNDDRSCELYQQVRNTLKNIANKDCIDNTSDELPQCMEIRNYLTILSEELDQKANDYLFDATIIMDDKCSDFSLKNYQRIRQLTDNQAILNKIPKCD